MPHTDDWIADANGNRGSIRSSRIDMAMAFIRIAMAIIARRVSA